MSASHEDRIVYLPGASPEPGLRFHLDENVSLAVANVLRRRGYDVTTTNDAGLRSQPDNSQMAHARQAQRVLVTRDRDFLDLHDLDCPHSGIVYWPHGRAATPQTMQELLLRLLQQVVDSPLDALELAAGDAAVRRRKERCRGNTASPKPADTNRLPPGLIVRGVVSRVKSFEVQVRLSTGQSGYILARRLPPDDLKVDQDVQAVTVQYVRPQRKLHLSMRRNFTMARTMPAAGLRKLRVDNHQLARQIELQWPVEMVIRKDRMIRVYGATSEAVREAVQQLGRHIPWTASAVFKVNRRAFKEWIMPTFGGLNKMARSTGTELQYLHGKRVLLCAESNRQLDQVLSVIQAQVPCMEIDNIQPSRSESLQQCSWPQLDDVLHAGLFSD